MRFIPRGRAWKWVAVDGLMATMLLAPRSSDAQLVRTAYTNIAAANSGKCLNIAGASTTSGAAAIQWPCDGASNAQWNVQPFNGAFRVIVRKSGQCLAVAGANRVAGAALVQQTCTGGDSELWTFAASGSGYQMVSKLSSLCANVDGASTANTAPIIQSACSTASNFIWAFSSGLFGAATQLDLQAEHSGQCLNVSGASKAAGAAVVQWPCGGAANEQWRLVPSGSSYQAVSRNSGLCLAVNGASTSSGATIIQSACTTASNLLWTLKPAGRVYQLVANNSGLCLTVNGASQTPAAAVVQAACGTAPNGLWSVSAATLPSSWTGVISLAVNPIAVANLPSGKLLMWSAFDAFSFEGDIGNGSGKTFTSVFDPGTGASTSVLVTNTGDDMFCPGTANLPDGRILVNGGSSSPKTSLYSPATGTWSPSGTMTLPRGYEGDTPLTNGSVLTLGGSWSGGRGGKNAEVWSGGTWHLLPGVTAAPVTGPDPAGVYRGDNHLWLFSVGAGQVFHAGPSAPMHWITTGGNGAITSAGNRGDDPYSINGNAALYAPGSILKAGGAQAYQDTDAESAAYVINLAPATSGATVTKIAPMAYPRAFSSSVILPNGQVVIVGGQTHPVPFSDATSILIPELWDPDMRVFRQLKAMQTPRVYHSTAILLPDGRVFSGGGGQCGQGCSANHFNAEILTPPYLLNADGSGAARPRIVNAPATGALGGTLAVTTGGPVASFVLMRSSSTTHTVNNDQRRIPLTIQATSGATSYTLAIPSDAGTVLPGYYMLFALDGVGVPSVSATIRIN